MNTYDNEVNTIMIDNDNNIIFTIDNGMKKYIANMDYLISHNVISNMICNNILIKKIIKDCIEHYNYSFSINNNRILVYFNYMILNINVEIISKLKLNYFKNNFTMRMTKDQMLIKLIELDSLLKKNDRTVAICQSRQNNNYNNNQQHRLIWMIRMIHKY